MMSAKPKSKTFLCDVYVITKFVPCSRGYCLSLKCIMLLMLVTYVQ